MLRATDTLLMTWNILSFLQWALATLLPGWSSPSCISILTLICLWVSLILGTSVYPCQVHLCILLLLKSISFILNEIYKTVYVHHIQTTWCVEAQTYFVERLNTVSICLISPLTFTCGILQTCMSSWTVVPMPEMRLLEFTLPVHLLLWCQTRAKSRELPESQWSTFTSQSPQSSHSEKPTMKLCVMKHRHVPHG